MNDADNIKQDMSIDVYGRKKADEYANKQVRGRHRTASPQGSACLQSCGEYVAVVYATDACELPRVDISSKGTHQRDAEPLSRGGAQHRLKCGTTGYSCTVC